MQIIAGSSSIDIAKEIALLIGETAVIPEFKIFPDGESYLRIPILENRPTLIIQSCYNPQDTNLFRLLNLIMTTKKQITADITVYIPYLCYARSDREVLDGEAVSINTVLHLIESVGVKHLIVLDIHNPDVLSRFSMQTTNLYLSGSIRNYLEENDILDENLMVLAPDEGALERAKHLAKELKVKYAVLKKSRDPLTGQVNLSLGLVSDLAPVVILVDDIISTGATLVEASNLLKVQGIETIHYVITHALGTEAVDRLQEIGNGIVVASNSTNTLISKISSSYDLVRVLDL